MMGNGAGSVDLTFDNLSVTVKSNFKKEKQILFNVSGKFPEGKLVGILGPSGAGKSTLLNVLSGFEHRDFRGSILVDGAHRNMADFRKISSYITQENDLNGLLTVQENMQFAADFKLGPHVNDIKKLNLIDGILQAFGLAEAKGTRTNRISGGQKKRLSIAMELLSDPAILFLDEPTTGLDSFSASQCLVYLKELASGGKSIVCTIHQPSATLFKLFDVVYILAAGRCLYHGQPDQIVPFFDKIKLPCNIYHNPADYAIELANGEHGQNCMDLMNECAKNGRSCEYFGNSLTPSLTKTRTSRDPPSTNSESYLSSELYEFKTLLSREYVKLKRNSTFTHLRVLASITNSIAISMLFWRLGGDAAKIWFNYNLVLAMIANLVVGGLMLTIIVFPMEMQILRKEFFNGYYGLTNYYLCITLLDLPLSFLCNLISNLVIYYCTDQPLEIERFVMFTAIGYMLSIVAQSIGLFLGASLNIQNGVFVGSYFHIPLLVVSGFGLRLCDLPPIFQIFSYLSYLRYGVKGLAGALYSYNRPKLPCPGDYCHYRFGEDFLEDMGVEGGEFWGDFGVLCVFYLGMRVASYVSMGWTLGRGKVR